MEENKINVLDKGFIELLDSLGTDKDIARCARLSYYKIDEENEITTDKILKLLMTNVPKHTSPFEQVEFRFLVKCPIFVARQWMRHRTGSYNEISRRYSGKNIEFYIPEKIRFSKKPKTTNDMSTLIKKLNENTLNIIKQLTETSEKGYKLLSEKIGVERELARIILPQNLYTIFYFKIDLHNLFHFLELRRNKTAQKEIQDYAKAIEKLIQPVVPISYKYWLEYLEKKYGK